jgi:hypothetical protein
MPGPAAVVQGPGRREIRGKIIDRIRLIEAVNSEVRSCEILLVELIGKNLGGIVGSLSSFADIQAGQ